jgi:hypothetical protein
LLVEVPDGDARSSLFRLKDYPKSANAAAIKGDIVRLRLIEQLVEDGAGLDDFDPRVVRQLGQLGHRYDAGDLRRFAKPKRDALVACYLVEARKTLLDQIVEMNDLFLTGMNRRARNSVEKQRKGLRRRARDGLRGQRARGDPVTHTRGFDATRRLRRRCPSAPAPISSRARGENEAAGIAPRTRLAMFADGMTQGPAVALSWD